MKIELLGIKKAFSKDGRQITVLGGVDTTIASGSSLAVLGISGSGKSTLLNIIGALMPPSSGEVLFDGVNIFALNEKAIAAFRNTKVGFVFQSFNLLPEFTCMENVALPALIGGKSRRRAESDAKRILEEVGLAERMHHRPGEVSGGEAQRVAVARALVMEPRILIADEPTGNLDRENGEKIAEIMLALSAKRDVSVIIATHNEDVAKKTSRQITLVDGRIDHA